MKETTFNLVDLFAGAGGLSIGFTQTGRFNVIGAVEINDAAKETFIYNHGNNRDIILSVDNSGRSDITQMDFNSFNFEADKTVVVGGPPCQGFSNANRQKNYLISGNNQLVKEYVRAIRDIKPIAFLMENVKSMNSSVHKFFVTKSDTNNLNDFSSEKHLDQISSQTKESLYTTDFITLLETENIALNNVASKFVDIKDVPKPIVEDPQLIIRLRTIESRYNKSGSVLLKTNKEKQEVSKIIELLKERVNGDADINCMLNEAIVSLQLLIKDPTSYNEQKSYSMDFVEYNRFLTRCQELQDEKIDCDKFIFENEEKYIVKIQVKSYNVVEYLTSVFEYYGYKVDSRVLDASKFGVPQRRKRFMMLGVRKTRQSIILPQKLTNKIFTVKDAIEDLEEIKPQHELESYCSSNYENHQIQSDLIKYYRKNIDETLLFNHVNTKSTELVKARFKHILEKGGKNFHSLPEELKKSYQDASRTQNTVYLRLNYDEPSPTVINVRKSMWQHPSKARALSIREAARLQSFPDNFEFMGRKDEQYQQVGNAVPPLLAKAVAEQMLKYLDSMTNQKDSC
ncbi:DNA cytosine methyltransferase [Paenisporosarcina antarctica]|uniref:DNA (cytosine-5-)-methyltransferase n=1 Tax=Paenisporosarcina antarctica TaxID=417367 RepID=A0A4P6ZUR5_9BACL|nr:DNA cytosine methyltransferase [Paenisporosarcina antarctica]QBP39708.1 DNA cytosine methyltransferase [Paenisporosarcina antarctica]